MPRIAFNAIEPDTFAEACYNDNTIADLMDALNGEADPVDMAAWELTAEEWRDEITLALAALIEDEAEG